MTPSAKWYTRFVGTPDEFLNLLRFEARVWMHYVGAIRQVGAELVDDEHVMQALLDEIDRLRALVAAE